MEKACGALTRKGIPCKKKALANGKCRLHGGKSTGPKDKAKHSGSLKGNKNAVKTGEHETISFGTLTKEEKELYGMVNIEPDVLVDGRIKMLEIRKYRLMQRYSTEMAKAKPDNAVLNSFEDALSRIDMRAVELIREKRDLLSQSGAGEQDGSLGQLNVILTDMRNIRKNGKSD